MSASYEKLLLSICVSLVGAMLGSELCAGEWAARDGVRVDVVAQTVSVEVEDASVEEVLGEIARKGGIRIETRGDLGRARSQSFEMLPLGEGILRVVGDRRVHVAMRYMVDGAGKSRLFEVYARASSEVPASLLEERQERAELRRIPPPPPPPSGLDLGRSNAP